MITRLLPLALIACIGSEAVARQIPLAGRQDPRMRTVAYNPGQVVRLSTAIGAALVVSFSSDEKVTAVAVTDSKDLVASPRDNFLFLKSKAALPPQPVIVVTSGPQGARRYVFELESVAMDRLTTDNPNVYYSVDFVYPGDARASRLAAREREEQTAASAALAQAHNDPATGSRNPTAASHNWHYVGRGNRALMPLQVFDNGFSTAFVFRGNTRIPSIYRINPDGKEAAVNASVKGNYVVVGSVAPAWRLRDGHSVLCIYNRAYDRVGSTPGTGTTSPQVMRITRSSPR